MSDALTPSEYEDATLCFWQDRIPDLEEITISVRIGGEVVRFVRFAPWQPAVEFSPDECHAVLTGG